MLSKWTPEDGNSNITPDVLINWIREKAIDITDINDHPNTQAQLNFVNKLIDKGYIRYVDKYILKFIYLNPENPTEKDPIDSTSKQGLVIAQHNEHHSITLSYALALANQLNLIIETNELEGIRISPDTLEFIERATTGVDNTMQKRSISNTAFKACLVLSKKQNFFTELERYLPLNGMSLEALFGTRVYSQIVIEIYENTHGILDFGSLDANKIMYIFNTIKDTLKAADTSSQKTIQFNMNLSNALNDSRSSLVKILENQVEEIYQKLKFCNNEIIIEFNGIAGIPNPDLQQKVLAKFLHDRLGIDLSPEP